jgi:hypothetical protein
LIFYWRSQNCWPCYISQRIYYVSLYCAFPCVLL